MALRVRFPGRQRQSQGEDASPISSNTCDSAKGRGPGVSQKKSPPGNSYTPLYLPGPVTSVTTGNKPIPKPAEAPLDSRPLKGSAGKGIPTGAVLLAHRFDSKPLERIPTCWCCAVSYKFERIQEWQGKQYAHLEPGCGCLDRPQMLSCCGSCASHCTCKARREKAAGRRQGMSE